MSILLVEDDATTAQAVRSAFSAAGFDVDSAESAEAALEKLNSRSYSLMLLDVGLPGIDGFELLRRLRAARQNVPVMIMSGHDEAHDRLRGFDLGADDYVVKPFLIDELRAFRRLQLWVVMGIAAIGFAGAFAVFGYISDIAQSVAGAPAGFVPWLPAAAGLPLVAVALNLVGVLSYETLKKSRRWIFFLTIVFAAFVTPTQDPFTMLAMAGPMIVLFELAIQVTRLVDRRRARRDAVEGFHDVPDDEASPLDARPSPLEPPAADPAAGAPADAPPAATRR